MGIDPVATARGSDFVLPHDHVVTFAVSHRLYNHGMNETSNHAGPISNQTDPIREIHQVSDGLLRCCRASAPLGFYLSHSRSVRGDWIGFNILMKFISRL